ncbi:MAG: EAL domain-containing protein [Gallionella sp.]
MVDNKPINIGVNYQAIFDASPDATLILSLKGDILNANQPAVQRYGYSFEELLQMNASDLTSPNLSGWLASRLDKLSQSGEIFESSYRCKDGREFPVEIYLQPITLQGAPVILSRVHDISLRKGFEADLETQEHFLERILDAQPGAVYIYDLVDNKYKYVNRHGLKNYEFANPASHLTGGDLKQIVHPDDQLKVAANHGDLKTAPDGEIRSVEYRIRDKMGVWRWLSCNETSFSRDEYGQANQLLGIAHDISVRKAAEDKAQRISRLYTALSQCNQAIVRCTSEGELLPIICHDAVYLGGMKMAWIGMVDAEDKMIKPVASFGSGIEYLKELSLTIDANIPGGQGPTGIAVRENRPIWCQDFQHDPITKPWHESGTRFGWGASGSIPLQRKGATVGAFVVYAENPNSFDLSAQKLLIEMSTDISFALDNFDNTAERKQALETIKYQNTILQTQQETSLDAILVVDENGTIISYNRQFIELWRLPEALVSSRQDAPVLNYVINQIEDAEAFAARVQYLYEHHEEKSTEEILLKDGRIIDRYSAPVIGALGEYYGRVWYFRDITERKHYEERIGYLANFDALTGLPNRAQLADHLKYARSLAKRNSGHFAMMFVDIDRFKDINDSLGHSIGDALLVEIARRIQSILREEDTAARLGGDEFILLLPDCDSQGAAQVAEKLLHIIYGNYRIEQYDLVVTASIGIAVYPDDGSDMEALFKNADTAMYQAKHEGRACYRFYTAEMQSFVLFQMKLIHALRTALEQGQFRIHYQPQISLHDGKIIGAEALLRWSHPELGNVSPAVFIPAAEESGLILPIGEWVMRTAVTQLKQWLGSGHPPFVIAVNLSAVQFRHPSLPDLVTGILNEAQLPPEYLELELTEGVAMHDPIAAIATMNKLHELGIRMSIDDFGTGYSSLNYLKKFSVYKLKIDQSFVRDISTDLEDKAIVAAIISMSKSLGLQTIAEGVETAEQLAYLREQGCNEVQGYYFSKPLASDQMEAFLVDKMARPIR